MSLFVLSLCPFDISVGIGAFVIRLGQISSFLSWLNNHETYEVRVLIQFGTWIIFQNMYESGLSTLTLYKSGLKTLTFDVNAF